MPKLLDGTTAQSSHVRNNGDYSHERVNFPVLGIVLSLRASDDHANNKSAVSTHNGRGSRWEAEVLVFNDGADTYWVIPNAVITSPGCTGIDDFHEELPRPCSQMIDGSRYRASMASIDPFKLDGDHCIVQFIGGQLSQPVITHWFPHPGNVTDTSTMGFKDGTLVQGKRLLKRYSGAEMVITPNGTIHVDTNNSGSTVAGSPEGPKRSTNARGGDVLVSVKPGREFEVNFNPTVPDPTQPSLPQPNPPGPVSARQDIKTVLSMDEDFINAVAGKVVQLIGKDVQNSILLGAEPTDHAVLGEHLLATFNAMIDKLNTFIDTYADHTHPTPNGQSGKPLPAGVPPVPNPYVVAPLGNPYLGMAYVVDDAVIEASLATIYPLPSQPVAGAPDHASEMPESDLSEVVKIQ